MDVLYIIFKSLKDSINLKRILPFFLLYLIFFNCVLIFSMPILSFLPSLTTLQFSATEIATVMVNLTALLIVFVIVVLLNLWFVGALIYDVFKKRGLEVSLKYSQKFYWQMIILSFIVFLFTGISMIFGPFGLILRIAIDLFLLFSLPAIIIKKCSADTAMTKSYNLVKNNFIKSLVFWVVVNFIKVAILLIGAILVTILLLPVVVRVMGSFIGIETITPQQMTQAVILILRNYSNLMFVCLIISLFSAFSTVFTYTSRTYYFLSLLKKR